MERFLDNLKKPNVGRGDALISPQNYLRTVTTKELQKSDLGKNVSKELVDTRNFSDEGIKNQPDYQPLKHPYYWGAWVCQGDIDDM
jgi:CHAT domain-containing protein